MPPYAVLKIRDPENLVDVQVAVMALPVLELVPRKISFAPLLPRTIGHRSGQRQPAGQRR